jgi:hypothetical protein
VLRENQVKRNGNQLSVGLKQNLTPGWHEAIGNNRRGENRNPVVYSEEYLNMTTHERRIKSAKNASGNGRCWWIYQWIMGEYKAQGNVTHYE